MSNTATPPNRRVRIASLRPACRLLFEQLNDPRAGLQAFHHYLLEMVASAAADGADAICLPEDCMMMMQAGHAETIDGPFFTGFAEAAARHGAVLVVGLVLRDESHRRNTTVIFGKDGRVCGQYHKTHLTSLEKNKYGITPGDQLPVFDTAIGRVGVMTCSDVLFPEVARILALRGASLVFFPHQMAEPDEDFFSVMVRSRAQDNGLPIVCCNFADQPDRHWYANWIIGADGRIVAKGPTGEGATCTELDLNAPLPLRDYIEPGDIDLREIIFRYRRPDLYHDVSSSGRAKPENHP